MDKEKNIYIVSGIPRSGTSLMMNMLQAGGVPLFVDHNRKPDVNNTKGYFEYEGVKSMTKQSQWMNLCLGKAIKIISYKLTELPTQYHYKILFMERSLKQILCSQQFMLESYRVGSMNQDMQPMMPLLKRHLLDVQEYLASQNHISTLYVPHAQLLTEPWGILKRIQTFLSINVHLEKMSTVIDQDMFHHRD